MRTTIWAKGFGLVWFDLFLMFSDELRRRRPTRGTRARLVPMLRTVLSMLSIPLVGARVQDVLIA